MAQYDYDLITIGAGSGGVRASRIAATHGAKVAVCEEYRVGGTCVIRGCVPKKMLVYGAHFAEDLQDAKAFGWDVGECRFDWAVLRDNVLGEVDRLNGLYTQTLENHGVTSPVWDLVFGTYVRVDGPIRVPRRMAMVWLVDDDGTVRPEYAADYAVVGGRRATDSQAEADERDAFANLAPAV